VNTNGDKAINYLPDGRQPLEGYSIQVGFVDLKVHFVYTLIGEEILDS